MSSLWLVSFEGLPLQLCRSQQEAVALFERLLAEDDGDDMEEDDISDLPYKSGVCIGPYSIYELEVGKYYDIIVDAPPDGEPVRGPARQ
jgi:hypothetical protein